MKNASWIRVFLIAFVGAFVVIAGAHLLRGRPLEQSLMEGLLWSAIAATIFTAARAYRLRKGQACAICGDTPQAPAPDLKRNV